MSYLLDTDILSLLERKQVSPKLARWISDQNDLFVSSVTLAELEYGLSQSPATHRESLAHWLKGIRTEFAESTDALTEPVLVRWKQLLGDLKKKNRTMTCEDSLIAATALHYGHTVVTGNTRHFEPSGVDLFNPLSA